MRTNPISQSEGIEAKKTDSLVSSPLPKLLQNPVFCVVLNKRGGNSTPPKSSPFREKRGRPGRGWAFSAGLRSRPFSRVEPQGFACRTEPQWLFLHSLYKIMPEGRRFQLNLYLIYSIKLRAGRSISLDLSETPQSFLCCNRIPSKSPPCARPAEAAFGWRLGCG